jgi:hypothetical protein
MGRNLQYYSGKNRIPCRRKRSFAYSKLKKEKKKDFSGRIRIKLDVQSDQYDSMIRRKSKQM